MKRKIVAFRQDERREWIAVLECGHTMHVRHNPPFQERAWVLTPEGRQSFIGVAIECAECRIKIRNAEPRDFYFVANVINDWWGGRNLRDMLPKLFCGCSSSEHISAKRVLLPNTILTSPDS
ncbi:DUF3565 domain-containing protein [Anaerolineae bacterium CFX7]|nr:DUF3565 domain-containing protein [Anaerolineae bacterium CFX7]